MTKFYFKQNVLEHPGRKKFVKKLSGVSIFTKRVPAFHPHMAALTLSPLGVLIPRLFKKKKKSNLPVSLIGDRPFKLALFDQPLQLMQF